MASERKARRFAPEVVQAQLLAAYSRCPDDLAEEIVRRVASRAWTPPVALRRAVATVTESLARHRLTDYDRMIEVRGLTRDEARQIVAEEVQAVLASWKGR